VLDALLTELITLLGHVLASKRSKVVKLLTVTLIAHKEASSENLNLELHNILESLGLFVRRNDDLFVVALPEGLKLLLFGRVASLA